LFLDCSRSVILALSVEREFGSDCLLLVSGSHSSEVEHFIGNEEVSGSNPDVSTKFAIQGQGATGCVEEKVRFN